MNKRAAFTIAVVTLLIGVIAGGWAMGELYKYSNKRVNVGQLIADTATTIYALKCIRAGYTTNAVEVLEKKLNDDLLDLGAIQAVPREFMSDSQYIKTLKMAKRYLIPYPHKSGSTEIDAETNRAFRLLNGQSNH